MQVVILVLTFIPVLAQDSTTSNHLFPSMEKTLAVLSKKTADVNMKIERGTHKYLRKLQKQESKLKRLLDKKDSTIGASLFTGIDDQYKELQLLPEGVSKYARAYSGHLDSLTTSLYFLNNFYSFNDQGLSNVLSKYSLYQNKLNQADKINKFLQQRQNLLREQFGKLGMIRQLRKFEKQAYYYRVQINEYKQLFDNPSKIEHKLLEVAMKMPNFQEFFARNSQLGSLFSLPGSNAPATVSVAGLQTRTLLNQLIRDRFGNGMSVQQMVQQSGEGALGTLHELKSKITSLSSGTIANSEDVDVPNFKSNNQKVKSFFKRLEYGGNFQSQKARNYFPATFDLALSLGYKLNDKSIIGFGTSYKLGLGNGWNNIAFSSQGISLRSFVDYQIKGSIYISGGYEQNYRTAFYSIQQLNDYSAWQSSGLLGLSKKYTLSKKLNGNVQLLLDVLSFRQVPRTQAVLFRLGYTLK